MIAFSFSGLAFNKEYCESNIDMIISSKNNYAAPELFLSKAVSYLESVVYDCDGSANDYDGAYLKEGIFDRIVQDLLSSMDEKIGIHIDDTTKIWRVKRLKSDPCIEEFLLETEDEYILLLWSTAE